MPRRSGRKKTTTTVTVRRAGNTRRAPRRRRSRRGRTGARASGIGSATAMVAKSLVDPWNCSACIPDGATGIGCFSVKQLFQLGTGTGSCCAVVWNLSPINQYKYDSGSAAVTPSLAGNYSPASQITTIQALYSQFRPVSGGMKVTYTSNTFTDQGVLLVGQVALGIPPSSFDTASLTTAQSLMQNYKIIPLRAGSRFTWRPECCDDMLDYEPMSSAGAISVAPPYPYLIAIVYGGNTGTTGLITVDCIANYEGQFRSQTFMPGGVDSTKQPAAEVGWYEKARNLVRNIDPILPMVGNAVGSYFGSPEGGTFVGTAAKYLFGSIDKPGLPKNNLKMLDYMTID